jgi:hypothetical protein
MARWMSLIALCALLGGCAAGIAAEGASVAASGKTLGDHVLDAATSQDCRLIEGAARTDRHICEQPNAPATQRDFKGVRSGNKF